MDQVWSRLSSCFAVLLFCCFAVLLYVCISIRCACMPGFDGDDIVIEVLVHPSVRCASHLTLLSRACPNGDRDKILNQNFSYLLYIKKILILSLCYFMSFLPIKPGWKAFFGVLRWQRRRLRAGRPQVLCRLFGPRQVAQVHWFPDWRRRCTVQLLR